MSATAKPSAGEQDAAALPQAAPNFLRLRDVMKSVALGSSTIYRWMDDKRFPLPVELGPNCVRWRDDEIERWKLDRIRATKQGRGENENRDGEGAPSV